MTTATDDKTQTNTTDTAADAKTKADAQAKKDSALKETMKSGKFWSGVAVGATATLAAGAAFLKWGVTAD